MEEVRTFLESSTIHGLAYIATSRKHVRIFWIIIVIAGFICAGILIDESFKGWKENPIKTTIETQSIKEITFPKVTVCPPKNTYTDLNYDLMMSENMILDDDTISTLVKNANDVLYENYAQFVIDEYNNTYYNGNGKEKLYDTLYELVMKNLSVLEDNDRYYNWYHGYTDIRLPYFRSDDGRVNYNMYTAASSGSISTQYFGDKFEADKVETKLNYYVEIYPPVSVRNNPRVTLHIYIENISMRNISSGQDNFTFDDGWTEADIINRFNFTPPSSYHYSMRLKRNVSLEEVRSQSLDQMPGFRVSWYYSGMEEEVQQVAKYKEYATIRAFVR